MLGDFLEWFTVDRVAATIGVSSFVAGFLFWLPAYRLSKRQHKSTETARREALEPMVVVDIAPSSDDRGILLLTVKNIGPSVARDVKISMSPMPIRQCADANDPPMSEWHVFKNGIPTMPPGHELRYFFDIGFRRFKPEVVNLFEVEVTADGPFGSVTPLKYVIDLDVMKEIWAGRTTELQKIKEIKAVGEAIKSLTKAVEQLPPPRQTQGRQGRTA